jgi:hypothetical protein
METMKKITMLLMLCMIVPLSAGLASAQGQNAQGQYREWSANSRGRGSIRYANQRDEVLTSASVELRRNGDAEVRVVGQTTSTFTGRWTTRRGYEVDLIINYGFNNLRVDGRGTLELREGGGIERLEITGQTRGQQFTVSFDSEGRGGGNFPGGGGGGQGLRDLVGRFRSSDDLRGRESSTLIRVLKLDDNGTVDLVSRYRGGVPFIGRDTERRYGRLVRDVSNRKKVTHSGTWRVAGRQRIEVTFTSLDGTRLDSRLTLEVRGTNRDQLVATDWDRALYGELPLQFTRMNANDRDDDDDGYGQTPDRVAGDYAVRLRIPDTNGDIERRLTLSRDGTATLTTQWMSNGRFEVSNRAEQEYGRLLRFIANQRQIDQSGRWQFRNNQVVIEFESRNDFRGRNVMTFDIRAGELQATDFDHGIYGTRSFNMRRVR